MKIEFDDGGSLEIKLNGGEVYVIVSAPSFNNSNELIVNAATLTMKQLQEVLADIPIKNNPIKPNPNPNQNPEPEPEPKPEPPVKKPKKVVKKTTKKKIAKKK